MAPATIDPNFKNDYLQNWNLNIQREVTPTTTVTIGYYASKGTHLRISEDPAWAKLGGSIPEITSGGNSTYNALWVTAKKRLARGLPFDAYYTYSHSIDYNSLNSQGLVVQDSTNVQNDRGSSDYDAKGVCPVYVVPLFRVPLRSWAPGAARGN